MASKRQLECAAAVSPEKCPKKMESRHPSISVSGALDSHMKVSEGYLSLHAESVSIGETVFKVAKWRRGTDLPPYMLSSAEAALKEQAKTFLSPPLAAMSFVDGKWLVTQLLKKSRGRIMVQMILTELIANRQSEVVVNIGGSSTSNEPYVRQVNFIRQRTRNTFTTGSSTDSSSPEKETEDGDNIVESCEKKFVPDLIVESYSDSGKASEKLLVEIKTGYTLTHNDENQLKFQLLPCVIGQKRALGLLICAKEAILMDYSFTENDEIAHRVKGYTFELSTLLETFLELVCDIYHYMNYQNPASQ